MIEFLTLCMCACVQKKKYTCVSEKMLRINWHNNAFYPGKKLLLFLRYLIEEKEMRNRTNNNNNNNIKQEKRGKKIFFFWIYAYWVENHGPKRNQIWNLRSNGTACVSHERIFEFIWENLHKMCHATLNLWHY